MTEIEKEIILACNGTYENKYDFLEKLQEIIREQNNIRGYIGYSDIYPYLQSIHDKFSKQEYKDEHIERCKCYMKNSLKYNIDDVFHILKETISKIDIK